jgi:N-acetyl-anhydromuramyl-L-alanine amidase AmpD
MKAQTPREIVIHHTAEAQRPEQTLAQKLRKLERFSRTAGTVNGRPKAAWGDVPYHFYIDLAGRIGEGRDINYAGDTNTRYSTANRIQIVLEGHFDKEETSPAQLQSLDRLVLWLAARYRVPAAKISGHNDHVATTDCPGRHLKAYLPQLRDKVAKASPAR